MQLLNALNEVASFSLRSVLASAFSWKEIQVRCGHDTAQVAWEGGTQRWHGEEVLLVWGGCTQRWHGNGEEVHRGGGGIVVKEVAWGGGDVNLLCFLVSVSSL